MQGSISVYTDSSHTQLLYEESFEGKQNFQKAKAAADAGSGKPINARWSAFIVQDKNDYRQIFFPLVFNVALKIESMILRYIMLIPLFLIDIVTLPIRLATWCFTDNSDTISPLAEYLIGKGVSEEKIPASGIDVVVTPAWSGHPKIVSDTWGEIKVEQYGRVETFKDVVLFQKAIEWDWQWRGSKATRVTHDTAYTVEDVTHFIKQAAVREDDWPEVLILSKGRGDRRNSTNGKITTTTIGPIGAKHQEMNRRPWKERDPNSGEVICTTYGSRATKLEISGTALAIQTYREYVADGYSVAAFIHTTC